MASFEFRIPISPTPAFFRQVHFFCAALRRVGGAHAQAAVKVAVGDNADPRQVAAENPWAARYPVEWHMVPPEIFNEYYYYGTADYRYLLPGPAAELVALADADTAVAAPLIGDFSWMLREEPCIAGHMAHYPPAPKILSGPAPPDGDALPFLFRHFSVPLPESLERYSIDPENRLPPAPAYYNFGFVVFNRAALAVFQREIFRWQDALRKLIDTPMRSQIACSLISHAFRMRRRSLPAAFNAANDMLHFQHNGLRAEEIRLIHYLRNDEMDRTHFLEAENLRLFLEAPLKNPVNQLLQKIAREIMAGEAGGEFYNHNPEN